MVRTGYLTLPLNPWPPEKGAEGSTPEPVEEFDPGVPLPAWETLPTMYDLPSEDPEECGLPDEFHDFQPQMLRETCQPPRYPVEKMFIGTNLNLYYNVRQQLWQKRPDWFLVLGAPRSQQQEMRLSYVIWQEGISPFLVVELLSPGTQAEDLGQTQPEAGKPPTKWHVYEQVLRIPYYVVFDRYDNQLRVFRLVGSRYEPVELAEPRFWLEELELGLGVWAGAYQGTEGLWLRWYDQAGTWLATSAERAEPASQRAEQEMAQREQAERELAAERQRSQHLGTKIK